MKLCRHGGVPWAHRVECHRVHCTLLFVTQILTLLLDPPSQPANGRRPAATTWGSHPSVPSGCRHAYCHSDSHTQLNVHSSTALGEGLIVRLNESTVAGGCRRIHSQARAGPRPRERVRSRSAAVLNSTTLRAATRVRQYFCNSDTHNTLDSHRIGG